MLWYEGGDISRILAMPQRGMISGRQPATESLDAEADNSDASRYREKADPSARKGSVASYEAPRTGHLGQAFILTRSVALTGNQSSSSLARF